VLHDGASLYVVWNGFSRDVRWIAELADLRERSDNLTKRPRVWSAELAPDGPFIDREEFAIDWTRTMQEDDLLELFGTFSGAIIRSPDERGALDESLRERIHEVAREGVVEVPMMPSRNHSAAAISLTRRCSARRVPPQRGDDEPDANANSQSAEAAPPVRRVQLTSGVGAGRGANEAAHHVGTVDAAPCVGRNRVND
jgi:hypothetical protein